MSPAHCCAVQMAFDRIVEQPTERSPTWDCKQARTRPPPGFTPAQRELTSVVQSRSDVNNPSCAFALRVSVIIKAAPSAIVGTLSAILDDEFNMVAFLCVTPLPAPPIKAASPFFSFWRRSRKRRTAVIIDQKLWRI